MPFKSQSTFLALVMCSIMAIYILSYNVVVFLVASIVGHSFHRAGNDSFFVEYHIYFLCC